MTSIANQHAFRGDSYARSLWRSSFTALVLLLAWTLFLYRDTGIAMVSIWARSETFTHCFLVLPIVLWLIWRRRRALAVQKPQPMMGAFFFVVCAAFVWLLGELAAVNAVTQLAFVALLILAVFAVLGGSVTRVIIFPLGFLFFSVPIGEFLMPQFMQWTADVTVFALRLSGIPVYREGLQFVIPSGNWSVVEACSGIRYLIASVTVGTLFAYLNYQSTKRRILFVLVSILVPVVANWMRAYLIVMLGHLSGNKLAAGVDHIIYGWLFFGVVIMLMFIIGARWAEGEKAVDLVAFNPTVPMRNVTGATIWTMTACFAALVTLPHVVLRAIDRGDDTHPIPLTAPAALAANWQALAPGVTGFKPAFQNPTAEINNNYAFQDRTVGLYLGYYRHQNYSRKLVSSDNVLVASDDRQWTQVASGRRDINVSGQLMVMRTAELHGGTLANQTNESRLLAWQIYWIDGTLTSSDYLAKAYGAFYRLMGRGDDSAVIVIYTLKDQAKGADEAVLESFLSANYAVINELLLKTRQSK